MRALLILAMMIGLAAPVAAEGREALGWGRLFTNDALGDGKDRWRTASYALSVVRGPTWAGHLPADPGEVLEFRLRTEFIAPQNLTTAAPWDRRYAGVLTLGLHTHFERAGFETSLGLDLAITGEQSGMSDLQDGLHDLFGMTRVGVADSQVPNGVHPTLVVETGHSYAIGRARLRPFVEAQAGLETFVRGGFDLTLGDLGLGGLMVRDSVTGQRYRAVRGDARPGLSLTLGGDVAHVFDSELLPEGGSAVLNDTRKRLRAGLAWQGERHAVQFGLTWLDKEFDTQPEAQTVGSLNVQFRF